MWCELTWLCSVCFPLSQADHYTFLVEWYDPHAALLRRYQLLHYPKDGSVEMLQVLEYGDRHTANTLGSKNERTLAMVKPDAVSKLGDILETLHAANLTAIEAWRRLLGPTDPAVARSEAQPSVRARFGTDGVQNAGHGSDSVVAASREVEFFFPTAGYGPGNTAQYTESTCCSRQAARGLAGKVLNAICKAGFQISALQMFTLDQANAEDFYEVYKGVVTEYPGMVSELCSGACLALEVQGPNAHKAFRDFCGPADPDKVQNAVHCSDLPEDAALEKNRVWSTEFILLAAGT
ncbi:hypothetical protein CRUP_000009 [Coryphaenoides rupestris]|nr:hypothetical protein CRUP_000009 [Coryphaenoides rupestris]